MGTADVRIDPKLNQELWSRGVKSVPHRMRLKLESTFINLSRLEIRLYLPLGKRNDDEGAKEKLYTYASYVPVDTFKASSIPFCISTGADLSSGTTNNCR